MILEYHEASAVVYATCRETKSCSVRLTLGDTEHDFQAKYQNLHSLGSLYRSQDRSPHGLRVFFEPHLCTLPKYGRVSNFYLFDKGEVVTCAYMRFPASVCCTDSEPKYLLDQLFPFFYDLSMDALARLNEFGVMSDHGMLARNKDELALARIAA